MEHYHYLIYDARRLIKFEYDVNNQHGQTSSAGEVAAQKIIPNISFF